MKLLTLYAALAGLAVAGCGDDSGDPTTEAIQNEIDSAQSCDELFADGAHFESRDDLDGLCHESDSEFDAQLVVSSFWDCTDGSTLASNDYGFGRIPGEWQSPSTDDALTAAIGECTGNDDLAAG